MGPQTVATTTTYTVATVYSRTSSATTATTSTTSSATYTIYPYTQSVTTTSDPITVTQATTIAQTMGSVGTTYTVKSTGTSTSVSASSTMEVSSSVNTDTTFYQSSATRTVTSTQTSTSAVTVTTPGNFVYKRITITFSTITQWLLTVVQYATTTVTDLTRNFYTVKVTPIVQELVYKVAPAPRISVKSKWLPSSTEFSGLSVLIDSNPYVTPQTSLRLYGAHTFVAPSTASNNGVTCYFAGWYDGADLVSTSTSYPTYLDSDKTFYAAYAPRSYPVVLYVGDAITHRPIVGASVYLDSGFVGNTDSYGRLVIQNVYVGTHSLSITAYGYNGYAGTINVRSSTSFSAYLTLAP